jgi:hypothetical protein
VISVAVTGPLRLLAVRFQESVPLAPFVLRLPLNVPLPPDPPRAASAAATWYVFGVAPCPAFARVAITPRSEAAPTASATAIETGTRRALTAGNLLLVFAYGSANT